MNNNEHNTERYTIDQRQLQWQEKYTVIIVDLLDDNDEEKVKYKPNSSKQNEEIQEKKGRRRW